MCLYLTFALSIAAIGNAGNSTSSLRGPSAAKGKHAAEDDAGAPLLLPLYRETVPVHQDGKVVSLKTAYSGKISIGSPVSQEFSVVFDTGSGHVVLPSLSCDSATCLAHRRYNITDSPKAWPVNADGTTVPDDELCDQATIGYGTGSVTGEFVHEAVCLGAAQRDTKAISLKTGQSQKICTTVNMVVAVEMSAQPFESFKFDGIFGLGLDSLALSSQFSFFSRFAAQSQSQSRRLPRFGFFLGDSEHGEQSEIAVGGHNADRLLGNLAWAPVATPKLGFWNVKIGAVRIGGVEVANCKKGACRGILDTGTSHLGVPSHHLETVNDLLSQSVANSADCRSAASPSLSIDINGFTITLGPEDYMPSNPANLAIPAPAATQDSAGVALQDTAGVRHCQPRIMPVNMKKPLGPNLFILGEPVLHRYYTVYDWHKQRVGFGLANSQKNRLRDGATAKATIKVEALDALDGDDEEIYLMQVSVTVTVCEDSAAGAPLLQSGVPLLH
jgi:hypothetical protein